MTTERGVRIDRWLWSARFFKTRSLAAGAITGGKVQLNGERVKRARLIHIDDWLRIRKGPYEYNVIVKGLSERRGPAAAAQELYEETVESKAQRERVAHGLKMQNLESYDGKGKPTKRDRRLLERFRDRLRRG